ncbi:polymorphic toxin type 47 domain-containing protein [Aeribacillus sp. FSL K6-2848]|uniref:polymorphic toxin type 47 domain-containing protein n=1 Tax=Aeribacillus sp. FSL K6-2848 TaxID=2954612 RepID=UPI0030F6B676
MKAVNVKYIPSEWEKTKKGIGDLVGLGVWGKGMIDKLKDLNDLLEDVQADIAKYDTDGVISFTHTDRKKQYQQLFEDYLVLHRFSSRVGEIVDRTIDDPFYQEIDAFVEAMRNLSISKIKTKNHIGAKKTVVAPGAYGTQQTIDVPKAEVGLEDLFSERNYYARLMEQEYASWKELNPKANFSKQEYIQTALNSRAFQYESIKDEQMNKEFWGQITALAVIVGTSFICPPAGMALGAAYGTLELSSAVSGKDWISGRELKTDERVFRGVLSPLDIVPGVKGLSTFSSAARFSHLREASDLKLLATKTGLQSKSFVRDMVVRAEKGIFPRIGSAKAWTKEIPHHLKNKSANSALKTARFVDNALTNLKNTIPDRQMGLAMEGVGNVKVPPKNTYGLENKVRAYLSEKTGLNLGEGKAGNDGVELSTKGADNTELGKITGYKFKEDVDLDFRGTGKTYRDALNEAFIRTGVPRTEFTVTKWGRDANGKSFPVEWRAKNGAEVNIDIGHTKNGPDVPHIGYQTGGKRGGGGAIRGHILVDDVPANR